MREERRERMGDARALFEAIKSKQDVDYTVLERAGVSSLIWQIGSQRQTAAKEGANTTQRVSSRRKQGADKVGTRERHPRYMYALESQSSLLVHVFQLLSSLEYVIYSQLYQSIFFKGTSHACQPLENDVNGIACRPLRNSYK